MTSPPERTGLSVSVSVRVLLIVLGMGLAGCAGERARLAASALDPKEVAREALAQFDTNKDGFLDAAELESCPGLKCCLARLDKDGDGKLSAAEIEQHVQLYRDSQIGLVAVVCEIRLDDMPLGDATVTVKPEPFLGSKVKPATGKTNGRGKVEMRTEGMNAPGCQCGFYRVEVSKVVGGQETVPPRYNSQTTLGLEVGPDLRGGVGPVFQLRSR